MHDEVPSWIARARCRGLDLTDFFQRNQHTARGALAICNSCNVRSECLQYAIENDMDYGVWGGLTERQRRAVARRQRGVGPVTA